jgi:hypothetical protein
VRLNAPFRWAIYAVFSILLLTGAIWLLADQMKDAPSSGEMWQIVGAYMLMFHGGAAMAMLMLFGALFPLHVRVGWRGHRNRPTGVTMLTFNTILIVTSFALYYAGIDVIRRWASNFHVFFGLILPCAFLIHIILGRRRS